MITIKGDSVSNGMKLDNLSCYAILFVLNSVACSEFSGKIRHCSSWNDKHLQNVLQNPLIGARRILGQENAAIFLSRPESCGLFSPGNFREEGEQ